MGNAHDRARPVLTLPEYQRLLDRFERCDGFTLPDVRLIVRIDAHRSGPEWQSFPESGYPFDPQFVRALTDTAHHLFCSGFRIQLGYVHGDEISVLLDRTESMTQRRRGRLVSLIASAGAVAFVRAFPRAVVFHSVLSELPTDEHAVDYFMWQRKVATRNFLSRSLGLALAAQGLTGQEIEAKIGKASDDEKWSLLAECGTPESAVSAYLRYGLLLWWERDTDDVCRIVECDPVPSDDVHYAALVRERMNGPAPSIAEETVSVPVRRIRFDPVARNPEREDSAPPKLAVPPPRPPERRPEPVREAPREHFRLGPKKRR